jgi:hypothetical protein
MDFLQGQDKRDRPVVPVSKESLRYMWAQRHTNATVGSCCAYLSSRLLGLGFTFVNSSGKKPSGDLTKHVRQTFVPFARMALDSILVHGFLVYGILPPSKTCAFPTPFIYAPDTFTASMTTTDQCQQVMTVEDAAKPKRKAHRVFVHDMPASDGSLTSRLALVAKSIAYMEEIEKNDIQAFAIRARPPVLTRAKTDALFDSRDVISGSEPGLRAQDESDNIGQRNRINIMQFKQQQQLVAGLNKNRIDTSSGFWQGQMDPTNNLAHSLGADADGFVPRFIPLPTDVDVAGFTLPEEKKDLAGIQKFIKAQVCMGLGVPESFVQGAAGGGNSILALKTNDEFIRISLAPLREAVNDLMIGVFAECFTSPEDEEGDEIDCYFPSLQNPALLRELFAEGLITRSALAKGMGPIFNLEQIDIIQDTAEDKVVKLKQEEEEEIEDDWKIRARDKDDIKAEKEAAAKAAEDRARKSKHGKRKHGHRSATKVAKRPADQTVSGDSSSTSSSDDERDEKHSKKTRKGSRKT